MNDRTRFTISVENDVYEAFAKLAEVSGVSLSRCIGDWLRDTAEAAQITAIKVEGVRKQPNAAFSAYIEASAEGVMGILQEIADGTRDAKGRLAGTAWSAPKQPSPPSSNTGGKVPRDTGRRKNAGGA
jgi:predicted transcriptional regulator